MSNKAKAVSGFVEIYALTHPDTGEIRYIGKANDSKKRLRKHLQDARRRRSPLYSWILSLAQGGKSPSVKVIDVCLSSEWQETEIRLIAEHRKSSRLLNLADGGNAPHCPHEVRKANAAKLNSGTHFQYARILRDLTSGRKFAESRNNSALVAKIDAAINKARSLPPEIRPVFANMYLARMSEISKGACCG